MVSPRPLQLLTLGILERAENWDWSVQGLGMLRLYIKNLGRLHIWDESLMYPNVSRIHNHSWDLQSTVIVGALQNIIYVPDPNGYTFWRKKIVAGYNYQELSTDEQVRLIPTTNPVYFPGDIYAQKADEIHFTNPLELTVTIMERHKLAEDEITEVYYEKEFGNAKSRPATAEEILRVTQRAVQRLEEELRK